MPIPLPVLLALIGLLGTVLTGVLGLAGKKFDADAKAAGASAASVRLATALSKVTHIVTQVVGALSHEITPDMLAALLKGDPAAKDAVLAKAKTAVLGYLGTAGVADLADAFGIPESDMEKLIVTQIEAAILAFAQSQSG